MGHARDVGYVYKYRYLKKQYIVRYVLNFDFSHLEHTLQSYGQIYFNIFRYILQKTGLIWFIMS